MTFDYFAMNHKVTPILRFSRDRYFIGSARFIDLVEGVDLAIRIGDRQDTSLIAERIGAIGYFATVEEPRSPNCFLAVSTDDTTFYRFIIVKKLKNDAKVISGKILNNGSAIGNTVSGAARAAVVNATHKKSSKNLGLLQDIAIGAATNVVTNAIIRNGHSKNAITGADGALINIFGVALVMGRSRLRRGRRLLKGSTDPSSRERTCPHLTRPTVPSANSPMPKVRFVVPKPRQLGGRDTFLK